HGDGLALANGSTDPLPPVYGVYDPTTSTASGLVSFYFVLTGPALPDVKLDLHAKLSAASTGVANARAEVVVRDESGNAFLDENACASTFYDCAFPSTVNQDYEFDVDLTGGGFQTFLVFNSADGYATDGGSFAASSDPEVTFAPGFDSTGYTLTFSPDPVAAPEPRFFGLLGLALAILLAVRRGHPYRT
ncbi:MAG: hypothetical protein JO099_04775, partial [Acidobacteriia bacterium]|nr:hypothetical protein [Terriglobia bacterium]